MSGSSRLGWKLFAFGLAICFLQIADEALFPTPIPEPVRGAYELSGEPLDILYLGDSTLVRRDERDREAATTAAMLAEALPERSVASLVYPGFRMTEYDALATALIRGGGRPAVLIVPINLRSFAAIWDMEPGMQFVRDRLFAAHDSFAFRATFNAFAAFGVYDLTPVSPESYRRLPYFDGDRRLGILGDIPVGPRLWREADPARANIAAMYLGPVDTDHRQVLALRRLIGRCDTAGIPLLLYVTPVNFEEGVAYVGDRFNAALERRTALVRGAAEAEGARIRDWSRSFAADKFAEGAYRADEHLRDTGRRALAAMLAAEIRTLSPPEAADAL